MIIKEFYTFFNESDFLNNIVKYYFEINYSQFCDVYLFSYKHLNQELINKSFSNSILYIYNYEDIVNSNNNYYINNYKKFNYWNNYNEYCNLSSIWNYYDSSYSILESMNCYCYINFFDISYIQNNYLYDSNLTSSNHFLHPSKNLWKRWGFTFFEELYNYYFLNFLEFNHFNIYSTRNKGIYLYFYENTDTWEIIAETYLPMWSRWDLYYLYAETYIKYGDLILLQPETSSWHLTKVKTIFLEKVIFYNDRGNWYIRDDYI